MSDDGLTSDGGFCAPSESWEGAARSAFEGMPLVSIPRGGIVFTVPPRLKWWEKTRPVRTVRRVRSKISIRVGKIRRFRKRVADTRAVWRGEKTAVSEWELD